MVLISEQLGVAKLSNTIPNVCREEYSHSKQVLRIGREDYIKCS